MNWSGKRVVVTGGAGMLGAHLCELFLAQGARVTVMDDYSRGRSYVQGVQSVQFPRNNAKSLQDCAVAFAGADAVFNLAAACGGLYHNVSHQFEQFWENVQLQSVPALAAKQSNVPLFIQVSTVCVYSGRHNSPAHEPNGHLDNPEPANAGYAWAKRMGERVCSWLFVDSPTKHVVVRPTNMYGPRDYFDDRAHVIPALVRKFLSGSDVVRVFGGPQTREFLYVGDAAKGVITAASVGENGEVYNLGTNRRTMISIAELAEMIRELTGSEAEIELVDDVETGDKRRFTDSSKIEALGWRSTTSLREGLQKTIEWYKDELRTS